MISELSQDYQVLTILAGYAHEGKLTAVTKRWIQSVRTVSSYLVLVFDQENVDEIEDLFVDDAAVVVCCERHEAYDFGSYKRGLIIADEREWVDRSSHVLLCNDSVVGPFKDLKVVLKEMVMSPAAVWGLTDSSLYLPHLQSYFLLIQRDVLRINEVSNFFNSVVPRPSRHDVIQAYELGFSQLISKLGLDWRSFLPISSMFDPKNGEPMTNSTAYPVCSLLSGSPILKKRSLHEALANADGIWRTCSYLSQSHPEIWDELLKDSPHRRFWQELIPVAVLLSQSDLPIIDERLQWIKEHPHPTLQAIVAVGKDQISLRAALCRRYKDLLGDGILKIIICDLTAPREQIILQLLASLDADWIIPSVTKFWKQPAALQLQLRHVISNPNQPSVMGFPSLRRRQDCFNPDVLACLMSEINDS